MRPYYVATPDGRWYVQAVQRGSRPWLRTWAGDSIPAVVLALIGIGVCVLGRRSGKIDRELQ